MVVGLAVITGICLGFVALIYRIYKELDKYKMYYRKGDETQVPIEYNPQDDVIVALDKEFSTSNPLAAAALETSTVKGWEMDDGILLELDLAPSIESKYLKEITAPVFGVHIVTTAAEMRKCLAIDHRLNRIVSVIESVFMVFVGISVFGVVALMLVGIEALFG